MMHDSAVLCRETSHVCHVTCGKAHAVCGCEELPPAVPPSRRPAVPPSCRLAVEPHLLPPSSARLPNPARDPSPISCLPSPVSHLPSHPLPSVVRLPISSSADRVIRVSAGGWPSAVRLPRLPVAVCPWPFAGGRWPSSGSRRPYIMPMATGLRSGHGSVHIRPILAGRATR